MGYTLVQVEAPNHIKVHAVEECEYCGESLKEIEVEAIEHRQVFDLPPVRAGLSSPDHAVAVRDQYFGVSAGSPVRVLYRVIAYNVLVVVLAALRAVYGAEKIDTEVSGYYLANELKGTYRGMVIALPPKEWAVFRELAPPTLRR